MAAETKLVLVRSSHALPLGMDLVDSRDGAVLAWARLHTAQVVADRVNAAHPDPDLAPGRDALTAELPSFLVEDDCADDDDDLSARYLLPSRERLEFVEVLSELVGWTGRRVSIFVGRLGAAGAASFTATLAGLDPAAEGSEFVIVRFERSPGFVDLDPDLMTAFRVRLEPIGARSLEFDRDGHRALAIQLLGQSEDPLGESGASS